MPGPCHTMPEPWHHMLDLCHDMPEPCHGLPNIFPLLDKICTVQLGPCHAESQLYVPSTTWLWEHCALSGVQRVMLGPLPDFSDTTLAPMPGDAIWVLSHIFNNIMLAPPYCSCKVMLVPPPSRHAGITTLFWWLCPSTKVSPKALTVVSQVLATSACANHLTP